MECLDAVDDLIKKRTLAYENLIYLYLNKAPCADYNGNRKNCLDKVIKWAKNNPTKKLVLGFRRPYAIGSFTERGSWRRPDKAIINCFFLALHLRKCMIPGYLASLQNEPHVQRFAAEFGHFRLH